jgi:hypothetical protein
MMAALELTLVLAMLGAVAEAVLAVRIVWYEGLNAACNTITVAAGSGGVTALVYGVLDSLDPSSARINQGHVSRRRGDDR